MWPAGPSAAKPACDVFACATRITSTSGLKTTFKLNGIANYDYAATYTDPRASGNA
jgi:hypothetical protein